MGGTRVALFVLLGLSANLLAQEPPKDTGLVSARIDPKETRIWVGAKVNGSPVRLVLDTGAEVTFLFRRASVRLGLAIVERGSKVVEDGEISVDRSESVKFSLGTWTDDRATLGIVDIPRMLAKGVDGVLGWDFLQQTVLEIDWDASEVHVGLRVPARVAAWPQWRLRENARTLIVEQTGIRMLVDTGAEGMGVLFGVERWRQWVAANKDAAASLHASYSLGHGIRADPVRWAGKLEVAGVEIEGMPVGLDRHPLLRTLRYDASMGLLGLSRFNLVVDGPGGTVYVQPRAKFAWKVAYNRLGAAFVPRDMESDPLYARVVPGSPAARAGIRDADRLLKVGDLDVTAWRTDPKVLPLSRFWTQPAGTELALTVARGEQRLVIRAKLEEIFPDVARYDP